MTAAPYPADTRAKGWRFELEPERIEQSDTWPLAAEIPMAQHALLMMWLVAWSTQVPCGSFPNDENVIRAKCRIPPDVWATCRDVLMRGWWLADDGRLYHQTLTQRVLEMMARRRSDSDRQAAKRARDTADSAGVTAESRVTLPEVTRESSTDHRPPTYSEANASESAPKRASRKCPKDFVVDDELRAFALGLAVDWKYETAKFLDHTFKNAMTDWRGAWKNWMRRAAENRPVNGETAYQRSQRERVAEMSGGLVSTKPPGAARPLLEVIHDSPFAIGKR